MNDRTRFDFGLQVVHFYVSGLIEPADVTMSGVSRYRMTAEAQGVELGVPDFYDSATMV